MDTAIGIISFLSSSLSSFWRFPTPSKVNNMANISICAMSFCKSDFLRKQAETVFKDHNLTFHDQDQLAQSHTLTSLLQTADAAIVGREVIDKDLLEQCPNLKLLSLYGVGHENINLEDLKTFGVTLHMQQGVNSLYAAELTIGLTISLLRNIAKTNSLLKENIWLKDGGTSLEGKKIAIVGAGHVGSKVATFYSLLGAKILLCDVLDKSELCKEIDARQVSFDEATASAELLSMHVPLTNLTRNMIKEHHLQHKQLRYFVNTSRFEVIEEPLLINSLKTGILKGAALDVWQNEPHINPMLSQLDNIIGTPHIGGNSLESVKAMGLAAIAGITNYIDKHKF